MSQEGQTFGLTGVEIEEGQKENIKVNEPKKEEKDKKVSIQINNQQKNNIKVHPQTTKPSDQASLQPTKQDSQLRKNIQPGASSQGKLPPLKSQNQSITNKPTKLKTLCEMMDDIKKVPDQVRKEKKDPAEELKKGLIGGGGVKQKEKIEKMKQYCVSVLNSYKSKIITDYDNLYTNSAYEKVIDELKSLEKKTFLFSEIQKNEEVLNQAKKMYNDNCYQIATKTIKLKKLKEKIEETVEIWADADQGHRKVEQQKEIFKDYFEKCSDEFFQTESLEYMVEDRIKDVKALKTTVGDNYKRLKYLSWDLLRNKVQAKMLESTQLDKNTCLQSLQKEYDDYNRYNKKLTDHFEEQFEDQLSEYEDKKALFEIFHHEQKRKEEQEKELQAHKEEELRKQKDLRNIAAQQIEEDTEKINHKLNKANKKFQDLRKVTYVQNADELLIHRKLLESCNNDIQEFKDFFEKKIKITSQEVEILSEKVLNLKYQTADDLKIEQDNEVMITMEMAEKDYLEVNDKCYKIEQETKRVSKTIDNISTIISRILYQLKGKQNKSKNEEVKKGELLNKISICSLRLEKMLAILSKKKDTIRVESINTDSTYKQPPDFLGVNPRKIQINQMIDQSSSQLDALNNSAKFTYKESKINDSEIGELSEMMHIRDQIKERKDPVGVQPTQKKEKTIVMRE